MTHDEAVKQLNELTSADPEAEHGNAEEILLRYLRHHDAKEVAEAFELARERCGFWYA